MNKREKKGRQQQQQQQQGNMLKHTKRRFVACQNMTFLHHVCGVNGCDGRERKKREMQAEILRQSLRQGVSLAVRQQVTTTGGCHFHKDKIVTDEAKCKHDERPTGLCDGQTTVCACRHTTSKIIKIMEMGQEHEYSRSKQIF